MMETLFLKGSADFRVASTKDCLTNLRKGTGNSALVFVYRECVYFVLYLKLHDSEVEHLPPIRS